MKRSPLLRNVSESPASGPGPIGGREGAEGPISEQASDSPREGELAAALHEVSNALTVVLGWLEIAQARAADGPAQDALEVASRYARLGHGMARRAIGAGDGPGEVERSGSALARAAVLAVTPAAERKGVGVRFETSTGLDDWVADGDAVAQVLLNLLLNAVAFSPAGGAVTLALSDAPGSLVFRVSDEGPGIEPERAATLFVSPDSTRSGGAGVGLVHAASLARASGGELCLLRPGPGACFELSWPRREAKSGSRHPAAPVRLEGARVLVLEDDPAVLGLIELALEARGATVVAITHAGALGSFDALPGVSAALLDLSPIADDPARALHTLRERVGPLPVVVISGSPTGMPAALDGEVQAWVRKPFEMNEVVEVLRGLLVHG